VFGFNSGTFDLNLLDKLERNVSCRITRRNILRILTFNEIAVFRISRATDGIPIPQTITGTARHGTAGAATHHTVLRHTGKRLVACHGRELNHRLIRVAMWDIVNDVLRHIRHCVIGAHINNRRIATYLDRLRSCADT
jgi:hypothetical protein